MSLKPTIFGFLALAIFLGTIATAQTAGLWSTSGKVTTSGEKVAPTGASVEEIKGWMTLGDIAKAYNVSVAEIAQTFALPAEQATPDKPLKELESETFSVTNLRQWLAERQAQAP